MKLKSKKPRGLAKKPRFKKIKQVVSDFYRFKLKHPKVFLVKHISFVLFFGLILFVDGRVNEFGEFLVGFAFAWNIVMTLSILYHWFTHELKIGEHTIDEWWKIFKTHL